MASDKIKMTYYKWKTTLILQVDCEIEFGFYDLLFIYIFSRNINLSGLV